MFHLCKHAWCGQLNHVVSTVQVVNAYMGANAPSTAAVRQFKFSAAERASISVLPLRDLLACASQAAATDALAQPASAAEAGGSGGDAAAAGAAAEPAAPVQEAAGMPALQQVVVESVTTEQASTAHGTVVVEEETVVVAVCPAAEAAALQGVGQATGGCAPADTGAVSMECDYEAAGAQQPAQASLPAPAAATSVDEGCMPDGVVAAPSGTLEPAADPLQERSQQHGTAQAAASVQQQQAESSGRILPGPVQQVRLMNVLPDVALSSGARPSAGLSCLCGNGFVCRHDLSSVLCMCRLVGGASAAACSPALTCSRQRCSARLCPSWRLPPASPSSPTTCSPWRSACTSCRYPSSCPLQVLQNSKPAGNLFPVGHAPCRVLALSAKRHNRIIDWV